MQSFLFVIARQFEYLQREGISFKDPSTGDRFASRPYILIITGDKPSLPKSLGTNGHNAFWSCNFDYCETRGTNRDGGSTFFLAHRQPDRQPPQQPDYDTSRLPTSSVSPVYRKARYLTRIAFLRGGDGRDFAARRKAVGLHTTTVFSRLDYINESLPGQYLMPFLIRSPSF